MNGKQKFFICKTCKNLVGLIVDRNVPLVCCGAQMSELVANTVEASIEKHLPLVSRSGNELHVAVGNVLHPMEKAHHIAFVYMETEHGGQRKALNIGAKPAVSFCLTGDTPVAVYAYCNLHGLWKTEIE